MDRQKVIDALNAYCEEANGCENCEIGGSLYATYCFSHNFENMADEDLKIYARTAKLKIEDDVEKKRAFLGNWCDGCECSDCVLCGEAWDHIVPGGDCLDISLATEEEIDRAIDIIQGSVKANVEPPEETLEEDPVNRPSHYTRGGIECIDAIAASMEPDEWAGFLKGQVLKYVWRYRLKGKPVEDLKKARYYLDRLIQATEKEEVVI